MARRAPLKVYRTAIGFHDAYVAAASQKAALEAWGSDKDLFARGVAELVTDPALIGGPLASPGKVIRQLRGSADEQMAALPPGKPRRPAANNEKVAPAKLSPTPKPKHAKPQPTPSRAKLEQADAVLAAFESSAGALLANVTHRERELADEKKKLLAAQNRERVKLTDRRDCAADDYNQALQRWRLD